MHWRVAAVAVAAVVASAGCAAAVAAAADSGPGSASCSADSYNGATLTLHCVVPQATVTTTKTATKTRTITASPSPSQVSSSPSLSPKPSTTSATPTPTPPSSSADPAPTGSFVDPATTGYQGDASALTVVPDQKVPAGCTWDKAAVTLECRGDAVLDHMLVKGGIDAYANLTVTNSVVQATPANWLLVNLRNSGNVCTVTHSTLRFNNAGKPPLGFTQWGVAGINDMDGCRGNYQWNDISGTPDGIDTGADGTVIRSNWVHDLAIVGTPPNDTHNDGVQLFGCTGCDISGNYFDIGWDGVHQNACFFESDGDPGDRITFNDNYLSGGGFAFRNMIGTNMTVTGNVFHPIAGQWDQTLVGSKASFSAWSGNVTTAGAVVPKPTP